MRLKAILTSILFASTLAGVASAAPIAHDHRGQPERVVTRAPATSWSGGVHVTASRPSWMPSQVSYGFQIDADADSVQPYTYGNDPYVEGIARGEWYTLGSQLQFNWNENDGRIMDLGGRPVRSLELQSQSGFSEITKIAVLLPGGRTIAFTPARALDAHSPNLRVDLGAAASAGVNRVIVYGKGAGTFRVLAA